MRLIHLSPRACRQWRIAFGFILLILNSASLSAQQSAKRIEEKIAAVQLELAQANIGTEPESLQEFFDSLKPNLKHSEMTSRWIEGLKDSAFSVREDSTRNLVTRPFVQNQVLESARSRATDPEVKWRLEMIIGARQSGRLRVDMSNVLNWIHLKNIEGLVPEIMFAVVTIDDPALIRSAEKTLLKVARESDEPFLTECLKDPRVNYRRLALITLAEGLEVESEVLLRTRNDTAVDFRLALAKLLIRRGDLAATDTLLETLKLLETKPDALELGDKELDAVKNRCIQYLRSATSEKFDYSPYDEPSARLASLQRWDQWRDELDDDFRIDIHLAPPRLGRILVGRYMDGEAVEMDEDFNVTWRVPLKNPFACQGLPSGHRLISQYSVGRVVEYDEEGNLVWELDSVPTSISGIFRTKQNTTLLACGQSGNLICEYNYDKELIWRIELAGVPVYAARLENGLTLVCLYGESRVAEIDHDGEVKWDLKVKGQPYFAQRLPNGNTLVKLSTSIAIEYDREGNEVASFEAKNGYSVERLEDGRTMIADTEGIRILDSEGELLKEHTDFKNYIYVDLF